MSESSESDPGVGLMSKAQQMKDLGAVRVILKTALASRLAEPCSSGRCAESYQPMRAMETLTRPPRRVREALIQVDILPSRRILVAGVETREGVATMVVALHRGRVRRRPEVNEQDGDDMVDDSIVSPSFEMRGRGIIVLL